MNHRIYLAELQLNNTNALDIEAGLNLSIDNDTVSTKNVIKCDIFSLILLISRFLIACPSAPPFMVFIYLNLLALPEHLHNLVITIGDSVQFLSAGAIFLTVAYENASCYHEKIVLPTINSFILLEKQW